MNTRDDDGRPVEVLLIEDTPGDVRLTLEAFHDANQAVRLHVATDGVDAMAYLKREGAHEHARRPSLIKEDAGLRKPVQLDEFEALAKSINEFWLTKVTLPQPQPEGR